MKTLNERLTVAFDILIENGVFLAKYNDKVFCLYIDQLQFVTNFLSDRDVRLMLSVCDLYSLKFGINYIPSVTNNTISVIFEDSNNG